MKAKDYLKFSGEILKRLHDFGIKVDDYQYIDLIKEYDRMRQRVKCLSVSSLSVTAEV